MALENRQVEAIKVLKSLVSAMSREKSITEYAERCVTMHGKQQREESHNTQKWRVARVQDTTQRQQVQQIGQQRLPMEWL